MIESPPTETGPVKAMTIYIAGPMTGIRDLNFPAFHAAARALRGAGFDVVNPAEVCPDTGMLWPDCMRRDIAVLVRCDAIALMQGWMDSRGARLERHIAVQLGMTVYDLDDLLDAAICNFALVQNTPSAPAATIESAQKVNPASLARDPGHITAIAKDLQ